MFDDPKKALEQLEQQLLAAGTPDEEEEPEFLSDEEYDDPEADENPLAAAYEKQAFSRRSAGFDAQADAMDTARYVPAPEKRKKGKLLLFLLAAAALALTAWKLRWLV